jgi:hypothetical protein
VRRRGGGIVLLLFREDWRGDTAQPPPQRSGAVTSPCTVYHSFRSFSSLNFAAGWRGGARATAKLSHRDAEPINGLGERIERISSNAAPNPFNPFS